MKFFEEKKQKSLNAKLLSYANEKISAIQTLLDKGADIHVTTPSGETLLDLAWFTTNVEFFLDKGLNFSSQKELHQLAYTRMDNTALFARLINMADDVNYKFNKDTYLIHSAVANANYTGSLQVLIDAHADLNVKNNIGDTPLHIAILCKNIDAASLLLSHHARLDIQNARGETPLELARRLDKEDAAPSYRNIAAVFNAETTPLKTAPVVDNEKISFVHEEPDLGLRITEIFNFKSGIYREIIYCPATNSMSNTVVSLSTLEDTQHLAAAEAEFIKQGGVPDYSFKKHLRKL
jgi:hypothetical protein